MIIKRNNKHIDLTSLGLTKEQIIILSICGSRMYGTATDDSDYDYIGIYIPTKKDIYLNNINHHIPFKTDKIDIQIWSIHKFIYLLKKGDILAHDLLHAPCHCWCIYNSDIWTDLISKRTLLYNKNMVSYVEYARKQAAKYGVKGTRIKAYKDVLAALEPYNDIWLHTIWDDLPEGEHIEFIEDTKPRMYQVCGKKYQETVRISYIYNSIQKDLTAYGKRAMLAEQNEGIDWKAISHAIRSAEQVYWIMKYGKYSYPLNNWKFIKAVKYGEIDFTLAKAVLEDYLNEIELLSKNSFLNKNNYFDWNKWMIDIIERYAK